MRNHSLDILKGVMAIGILLIHTGQFVVKPENMGTVDIYVFSMTSIIVPTFFIISGYFFAKNRNKDRAIVNIVTTYLLYMFLIVIFNTILLGYQYNYTMMLTDILPATGGFNYFWFVNSLIYYMLAYFVIDRIIRLEFDKLFWMILLFLGFSGIYLVNIDLLSEMVVNFAFFSSGYVIAKSKRIDEIRTPTYALLVVLLLPFFINMTYASTSWYCLFFGLILFLSVKSLGIKKNIFCFYSKYSLLILFVHCYGIQVYLRSGIEDAFHENYFLIFLLLVVSTLMVVHIVDFISRGSKSLIVKLRLKIYGEVTL